MQEHETIRQILQKAYPDEITSLDLEELHPRRSSARTFLA